MEYYQGELRELDLRPSDMKYLESTTFVDVFAMRHELRTVGELYDFLCEHELPHAADYLQISQLYQPTRISRSHVFLLYPMR